MNKHRGNILFVTLIFFVFATTALFAILNLSLTQQRSTAQMVAISTQPYTCQTVADLAVDSAVYSLCTTSATVSHGFVEDTASLYNQALNTISDGVYLPSTITELVSHQGLSTAMEEALLTELTNATIAITLQSNLEIQPSASNVLAYADGDTATLKPITVEVVVHQGVTTVSRTYEISGLTATFRHMTSGIYTIIHDQNATTTLVAQTIY